MDFPDTAMVPDLDVAWIHGSEAVKYNIDPDIQVHACDEHGCHIEMSTKPGVDYPVGWTYQLDETPLQLTTDHLLELQRTIEAHDHQPGRYVLPQMIVTPER